MKNLVEKAKATAGTKRVLGTQASLHSFFKPTSNETKRLKTSTSPISSETEGNEQDIPAAEAKQTEALEPVTPVAAREAAIVEPLVTKVMGPKQDKLLDILSLIDESWRPVLQKEAKKPYFSRLEQFLEAEYKSKTIFPPIQQIFTAFNLCSYSNVKVVIIGQDPYHGPRQAHGLAFSVMKDVAIPMSLRNIFTEAKNDVSIRPPTHGNLSKWSEQGVLLLNVCLSVRQGEANSHQSKGWEEFTDAVVRELSKKSGLVYLLWGLPAQQKCKGIDTGANCVLTSSHPSPLGAYKTAKPFMGSRCFSRCNEYLEANGLTPIDWNV